MAVLAQAFRAIGEMLVRASFEFFFDYIFLAYYCVLLILLYWGAVLVFIGIEVVFTIVVGWLPGWLVYVHVD